MNYGMAVKAAVCINKFNTDCFYKPVMYHLYSDVYINLVDYIYLSSLYVGNGFKDSNFYYSAVKNGDNFKLNFNKFYKNLDVKYVMKDMSNGGIDIGRPVVDLCGDFNYLRTFSFNNISSTDDVIESLYAGKYTMEDVLLANYTYYGKDLSALNKVSYRDDIFLTNIIPQNLTRVLNIKLCYYINSRKG